MAIIKLVTSYIKQSDNGLDVENPKCDFKKCWYDLTELKEINEFIKDTTAIANTFGLDGFIIIGYDVKTKVFNSTTLLDSKLKDSSQIIDLLNKRVDQLFELTTYDIEIEGNKLSVIHIPPSIDKPHVIRNYQVFNKEGKNIRNEEQKIFIRKNSSTFPASKYDIELMFYDKKNIIPEYKVAAYAHVSSFIFSLEFQHDEKKSLYGISIDFRINIENLGRRPIAINKFIFSLWLIENPNEYEIAHFESLIEYKSAPIVVQKDEISSKRVGVQSVAMYKYGDDNIKLLMNDFNRAKKLLQCSVLTMELSNGNKISCPLILNRG